MSLDINALSAGNFYGKNTLVQRSANAGASVASIFQQGRYQDLAGANITYSEQQNGKVNIDGALAYSRASMAGLDGNKDNVIDANDNIDPSLLRMVDSNGDGKISNAENTAYTMFTDTLGGSTPNGVITADEQNRSILPQRMRQQAQAERALGKTDSADQLEKQASDLEKQYHDQIAGFTSGMKLEERDKALNMPTRSSTPGNLQELGLDKPAVQNQSSTQIPNFCQQNTNQNNLLALLEQILKQNNNNSSNTNQQNNNLNQTQNVDPQQALNIIQQIMGLFANARTGQQ